MESASIIMSPGPGTSRVRYVGDRMRFEIRGPDGLDSATGCRAYLRTTIGRATVLRREIVQAHSEGASPAGAAMHDIPMSSYDNGWYVELGLGETGFFQAKAYIVDTKGWQHWPDGPDFGLSVHPDYARTANTIYCAFPRMFGPSKAKTSTNNESLKAVYTDLDKSGHVIIPPSGRLRDVVKELPHIIDRLGCRILHLLPVNPVPTTYARFGRYGSPYAALDLAAIDPALVEFDRRTTGVQQFEELACAVHDKGARVFLDIVINHTGWGSAFHEDHPDWFLRNADGTFKSPGAWGNTWEDLVELRHQNVSLWDEISEALLKWCERGVDGFRCDAGYMVPVPAWQYIIARVQEAFPDTVFLLEGLGGAWEATEALLTHGGMQWAYSELFQNYSGEQVSGYLSHALKQQGRCGTLVHYSETHDNDRLAVKGRNWSLLRNRLCALASESGGFGFTCGAEWLATEKINVHSSRGLAWGNSENIVDDLARLNALLANHPCFFDGCTVCRLSADGAPVLVLLRQSASREDQVLVLVNLDTTQPQQLTLNRRTLPEAIRSQLDLSIVHTWHELLGQSLPADLKGSANKMECTLEPGAALCIAPETSRSETTGADYRAARARAAWAMQVLCKCVPSAHCGGLDWQWLAEQANRNPKAFLGAAIQVGRRDGSSAGEPITQSKLAGYLQQLDKLEDYSGVVGWEPSDQNRVTPVPANHWLLIRNTRPFRATVQLPDGSNELNRVHVQSIPVDKQHIACVSPSSSTGEGQIRLRERGAAPEGVEASLVFLPASAADVTSTTREVHEGLVLLTNGRGGMARICADLGRVKSKYDCVLGANLHPEFPVDRHVLAKRIRVWINAHGFISPLDARNLLHFDPGPPAKWHFAAHAGDGKKVEIVLTGNMTSDRNETVFRFFRPEQLENNQRPLPAEADVRLTIRVDIEDRNFHWETKRNDGAEHHFASNVTTPKGLNGFQFKPAADRQLTVASNTGQYHAAPEWSENLPHPVEQSRGQTGSGDAFSPGWFEIPLTAGADCILVVSAEQNPTDFTSTEIKAAISNPPGSSELFPPEDGFGQQLIRAARDFVVRRNDGKTVIAGYPWFLDWGRDSLIAARGLLAGGSVQEVRDLSIVFARFEQNGTLPNTIHGGDASNRDTSDAPLWFGVVCEELAEAIGDKFFNDKVDLAGRTIRDVLVSIGEHLLKGTPNRIKVDPESALVWSPSHFTWMDTNYPAGTPREGYPVEIQALWIRLLRLLARLSDGTQQQHWAALEQKATDSLNRLYWSDENGWFADVLLAGQDTPALRAVRDDALRSNCLAVVALDLVHGERARRTVLAAQRQLVVPGALRSLAPLPVTVPLAVHGKHGGLLNDPHRPYWGRYEGDEDTRRKPAYHNGTAWTWTFPMFCEALARAWSFETSAVDAARGYLGSMAILMKSGCLGQIPEVIDGDAPHLQRGCDAQAWGVTEAIRVWRLLNEPRQRSAPL